MQGQEENPLRSHKEKEREREREKKIILGVFGEGKANVRI